MTGWVGPTVNIDKCYLLSASVGRNRSRPLSWAPEVKGLGVIVKHEFQPSKQCQVVVNKARIVGARQYRQYRTTRGRCFAVAQGAISPFFKYFKQFWAPVLPLDYGADLIPSNENGGWRKERIMYKDFRKWVYTRWK